jgi:hypothetical protein
MMNRRVVIVTTVIALTAPLLVAAAAPAQASTCAKIGKFTGSKAHMERWLRCKHVPFTVVHVPAPTMTLAVVQPDSGGPSCEWLASSTDGIGEAKHSVVKACYSKGVPHLICSKWFAGSFYPYHCGPLQAYSRSHAKSLWEWIKDHYPFKAALACGHGEVTGIIAGVIVGLAGGGWLDLAAGTVGGCVGGVINYYWK